MAPILGILLAAILGLQVLQVLRPAGARAPGEPGSPSAASTQAGRRGASQIKDVAIRLQRDNLHTAAAQAYEEYLLAADLKDEERANVLLEVGNLLAKAGKYEDALARYFRASPIISGENESVLRQKILECLGRLGKHTEQGYELKDRLVRGPGGKTAGDDEAGKVVAWIGPQKITASELEDQIAQEIEERAASIPGLPPEKLAELKAQAQKQFQSPQAKLMKLREFVAREVLYREGLEREVDKSARVQKRISDISREAVIEEMVLSELRDRIKVSDTDLKNHYKANPTRYKERASARIRLAVLGDEAKAKEAIALSKTEDDFAKFARENSLETGSREKGGVIDEPLTEGSPVPVLGASPELSAAIFATDPGRPIAAPVKVPSGYAVAFVRERTPERTPSFEEVREQVAKDYVQEKEAEVQSALVQELMKKHAASILTEAFLPRSKEDKKDEEKKEGSAPPPAPQAPAAGQVPAPAPDPGAQPK